SGGDIWSGSGATINNQAGGLFDLQADQTWTYNQGGAPPVLNNAGTVQKSAGTGTTAFESIVNNGGTLAVQSGTVNMVNGGDSHGNFSVVAAATLNFGGGAMTLETNSTVSAAGTIGFSGGAVDINGGYTVSGNTVLNGATVNFNTSASMANGTLSGGNLSGVGTFTVNGTLTWTAGSMTGAGTSTIAHGASLLISSGGIKGFAQRTINNAGAIRWSGGDIWSGDRKRTHQHASDVNNSHADHCLK